MMKIARLNLVLRRTLIVQRDIVIGASRFSKKIIQALKQGATGF